MRPVVARVEHGLKIKGYRFTLTARFRAYNRKPLALCSHRRRRAVRFDYASVGGVSLARDQIGGSIIGTRS